MMPQAYVDKLENKWLSPAQMRVAQELFKGKSNQDIADALVISEKTVKFHNTQIFEKLGVKTRVKFILWCIGN